MILVDTSIWVNHFRIENYALQKLLEKGSILGHPLVNAEVAMGSLRDREKTLYQLDQLPLVRPAHVSEVRALVERRHLYGRGIGFIDASLLASVLISSPALLWTVDKRLQEAAKELGVNADALDGISIVH